MIEAILYCPTCQHQLTVPVVDATGHKTNDWAGELLQKARATDWLDGLFPRCQDCVAQGHDGAIDFDFRLICDHCQSEAAPMTPELRQATLAG
ncbi:MAG: hypothetical protein KKA73_11320, partial [Chloroflexi bacterium]|nr:hypothetical protein [Chloroflexota bacterium]MBU1748268.1 hypothetical protein [Chloroflexota bacterium]